MDNFSFLNAAHAGYFSDLYDQYLKDPDSLEPSWKAFFQGYDFANSDFLKDEILDGISPQIPDHVQKEFKVINLINASDCKPDRLACYHFTHVVNCCFN